MPEFTAESLLLAIVRAVQGTHPLDRQPPIEFQATEIDDSLFVIWDARPDASESILTAVAGQFGDVIASIPEPIAAALVSTSGPEDTASWALANYIAAVGVQPDGDDELPF